MGKTKKNSLLNFILIPEVTAIIPPVVVAIIASILNPAFLSSSNLSTLASAMIGSWGILAVGQSFNIMVGELDIAIGATFTFAGMIFCYLLRLNLSLVLVCLITIILCMAIQLLTIQIVMKFEISSFITTLATSYIWKGLSNVVNYGADLSIAKVASKAPEIKAFCDFCSLEPLGISMLFWVFIAFILMGQFVLKKTNFGMQVYAVGDNKKVASIAGLRVKKIKSICFLISGFLIGINTCLWCGMYNGIGANQGAPWGFITIAAVAMGGTSFSGGSGSMFGTFFGVMLMALVYNLITLLKIDLNYQNIFIGVFLMLATILDVVRKNYTIGKNI